MGASTPVSYDGRRVGLRTDVRSLDALALSSGSYKRQMLSDTAPSSWVEMAYESEWSGHVSGPFAFTREIFDSMRAIFDAGEQPLVVNFGHARHDMGVPVDAAGWIQALEIRDGEYGCELWALVEWTDDAADRIRAGKYRFCSVEVTFSPVDRATGDELAGAELYALALTNSPFLPGMTPITLSRAGSPVRDNHRSLSMDPTKVLAAVAAALGLPKGTKPEKMKGAFEALVALASAMGEDPIPAADGMPAGDAGAAALSRAVDLASRVKLALALADANTLDPNAPAAEVDTNGELESETAAQMVLSKLMEASGLDEAGVVAGVTEKLDQLAAVLVAGPVSGMSADASAQLSRDAMTARASDLASVVDAQSKRIAELEARESERTAQATEQRVVAAFSRLVGEGRVTESQRADFVKAARVNEKLALDIYGSLPATLVPPSGSIATGPAAHVSLARTANDPVVKIFADAAKAKGLRGKSADEYVDRCLSNHHRKSV